MKNLRFINKSEKFYSSNNKEIKTTDINILLNRVRSSKRDDIKKKIYLISLITLVLSSLVYIIIV